MFFFFQLRLHGGKAKFQYPNVIMGRSFAHRRTFATKHALLRVIPTVANYSATVSDISSGSVYIYIYGIYVLTFYSILTFFSAILSRILFGILSGMLLYLT